MPKSQPALEITKDAKDTFIDKSEVEGIKNSGTSTSILKSKIYQAREKNPTLFWLAVSLFLAPLLIGILLLLVEYNFFASKTKGLE